MLPLLPVRRLGTRSSILQHTFPPFYACYLLKSIQTPQSPTVYIGSTPSPPRRIRQHNGELAQGARKTRSKRPWIMQMIVHGFPSRLAALQFEWAWQHPHKSRHMRDSNGRFFGERRHRTMSKNVAIVRSMIGRHPFKSWPLHVKLFTEEAVHYWNIAAHAPHVPPLPPGFTYSVELEGVDGKSGHPGSGRTDPMAADDAEFTAALLAKNTALLASGRNLSCSVCHDKIDIHENNVLSTALCPSTGCVATSHMLCLSQKFLKEEGNDSALFLPRGGTCDSCGKYTLWGDIVRGCYRRLPPAMPNGEEHPDIASDDMFVTDEDLHLDEATPKRRSRSRRLSTSRRSPRKTNTTSSSSEGEMFDFNNIASSSGSDSGTPKRKPGRPRGTNKKTPVTAEVTPKQRRQRTVLSTSKPKTPKSAKAKGKAKATSLLTDSSEGESFNFSNIGSSSDSDATPMKRKMGRPRKIVASTLPAKPTVQKTLRPTALTSLAKSSTPVDNMAARKPAVTRKDGSPSSPPRDSALPGDAASSVPLKRKPGRPRKDADRRDSSEGEPFNFSNIGSSSDSDPATPMKRKMGRPRKIVASTLPAKTTVQKTLRPTALTSLAKSSTPVDNMAARKPAVTRKDGSPSSPPRDSALPGDAASSVPLKRKPGRPRKDADRRDSSEGESFNFSNIGSSSDSDPATPMKRKMGRPRKIVTSTLPAKTTVQKTLRPITLASLANSSTPVDNMAVRKPAVKRKDGNPSSPPRDSAPPGDTASSVPLKRKPGRPRKDASPHALPTHTPALVRPFHSSARTSTRPLSGEPISSDSSSSVEIVSQSCYTKFDCNTKSPTKRAPEFLTPARRAIHPTRPPSSWLDDALELAMSSLTVSTPSRSASNKPKEIIKEIEVIELSD